MAKKKLPWAAKTMERWKNPTNAFGSSVSIRPLVYYAR